MDNIELGKRLKNARLAKKMTQSEVAGNFITRNMLSLIESGNATPSMKTLEYLSGVLEIPVERLLAESVGEDWEFSDFQILQNAKKLLADKKYRQITETVPANGAFADELHAIRAIAYLETANLLSVSPKTEEIQQALQFARTAAEESGKGIYANESRTAQANQLVARTARFLSEYYSSLANPEKK